MAFRLLCFRLCVRSWKTSCVHQFFQSRTFFSGLVSSNQRFRTDIMANDVDYDIKKAAFSSLSANEMVIHVDEANNVIGAVERKRMRSENLLHRATYIFVQNSRGQFYVQKRTMIKDYCPGYFDPAPGGVLQMGENYAESAKRELEEEMGIKDAPMTHCFTMLYEDTRVRCFGDAWFCIYDGDIKLQEEEVESVHMMTLDEILEGVRKGQKFCPDSLKFLERFKDWLAERRTQ